MVKASIRPITREDAQYIGEHLRADDIAEMEALGAEPSRAVALCVASSDYAWVGCFDDVPALAFGCTKGMLSNWGEIWALGTDACTGHPREMLQIGRSEVQRMLEIYPLLENHCDARYKRALRWLRGLGFTVEAPEPYGPNGFPFCRVYIKKEN